MRNSQNYSDTRSVKDITGWYLVVLGQYRLVLVGTWWNWDHVERYCLVLDGTGSLLGGIGQYWFSIGRYLVVLGQYNLVLLGIQWYWVSIGLLCLYILKKWTFGQVLPIPHTQQNMGLLSLPKI